MRIRASAYHFHRRILVVERSYYDKKEAYEKLLKHIEGLESYAEYIDLIECLYVLIAKEGNKNA